ncbi:MAG: dTDP-4-dehydrorhamnose 3,5-epimerase [Rhodothermales bacterium]|nr:dTDP-4-dehydrorhamnose 3,5-epimerase [Rhodothermales bacterium]
MLVGSPIDGVRVFTLDRFADERGFFQEVYNEPRMHAPLDLRFVQDNVARSKGGVLRGMHYQQPHPQGKLVTVLEGEVFDAIVDVREDSPTFGKWCAITLNDTNGRQVYVPEGCAHGYLVLSESALVYYKCTTAYEASASKYLRWDDPDVGIEWPLENEPTLSDRDRSAPRLREVRSRL